MTSEIFSRGQAFLAQGTDHFLNKMLSIRKVRLLITSRYIAMQSYECVIISKMFLIYFISYGCNGGALVFLRGAEASASPSFALPMFITIKKIIILHLFLGVPAATVGGTGTPWHTRGYAPDTHTKKKNSDIWIWSMPGPRMFFFSFSKDPIKSDINNYISAAKWLISINRIQNKSFCLHNICMCTLYI